MSKEIAQTVGGRKIAYLFAILTAFAALAYLATNNKVSEAAEDSGQASLVLEVAADVAIPGGGVGLAAGANAKVQLVSGILIDALTISSKIQEFFPQNCQKIQTVDMINIGTYDVSDNVDASSFWGQSLDSSDTFTTGNFDGLLAQNEIYSAVVSRSSNPWSAVSKFSTSGWDFFHERYGSGEVIASSKNVGDNLTLSNRWVESA